ncbi:hypothetical protein tinsulaeT_11760 [Thalassotalea insulae]|uniref:GH16 domain-containing protein n=1 Tax=Thalassotalea insulae TaxID=2056778 RepID=A0ABQ6GT28_9GAMM|nr:family 16 glycosylhydrolase [Thalassotalea insulae]GLX77836.1 hypothetical protein tinsulaeT_11760 [Thalassotalea insulae]
MKTKTTFLTGTKYASLLCSALLLGCGSDSTSSDNNVEQSFTPVIDSQAITSVKTGELYTYTLQASDKDSEDTLTFTAANLPSWLSFEASTGELSGTPSAEDVGVYDITLTVSDGSNETTQSFSITVELKASPWQLVWSDEFDGETLKSENWNIETGDGSQYGLVGWGNNELQWYQQENITVSDGNLVITAKKEQSNGYGYTSGRMRSDHKVDVKYGRIEARIKAPLGQGVWSAFWMLPTDSQYGGWASGGEIDIMEVVSPTVDANQATHGNLHYGMAWPMNVNEGNTVELNVTDDYHLYAIEWEKDEIRWYIDDLHYTTIKSDTWWSYFYKNSEQGYVYPENAPYDQKFHLIFNLAIGGFWPGSPDEITEFPAQMLVDYVRVYECSAGLEDGSGCADNINSTVPEHPASQFSRAEYLLYSEGGDLLTWQVEGEAVTRELQAQVAWDNGGAISLASVDGGGEHDQVLEITTSNMGNVAINAVDGKSFKLFGMGTSAEPWKLYAGELKFELYIDSSATDLDSSITIKMDSGWPALGYKTLNIADLKLDQWQQISVPVNDLVATPGEQGLDTSAVVNLFVIEFGAAAKVNLDNVRLICGHKEQNGCGIEAPSIEIESEQLEVLMDDVNTNVWDKGVGAWDTVSNTDYFDGSSSNHINWQLVDSDDSTRGKVLEVSFSDSDANGVLYIQSSQSLDMSAFASGELAFDIKVTDYADNTSGMVFKVDCVYPCSSGDQSLGKVGDGVWEHVSISVADLITSGLDITSVNTGIVLLPANDQQANVTFQVDNIVWNSTYVAPEKPSETVGAITIYSDSIDSNWTLWDCCGGATLTETTDSDNGAVVEVSFNSTSTVSGFQATIAHDASTITNGTLEFDLKLLAAPVDSSAQWFVKLESPNAATAAEVELLTSNEGVSPQLDQWQHFTFPLETLAGQGLDLANIKLLMVFPTWGKANGAVYLIDNVEIKEN